MKSKSKYLALLFFTLVSVHARAEPGNLANRFEGHAFIGKGAAHWEGRDEQARFEDGFEDLGAKLCADAESQARTKAKEWAKTACGRRAWGLGGPDVTIERVSGCHLYYNNPDDTYFSPQTYNEDVLRVFVTAECADKK